MKRITLTTIFFILSFNLFSQLFITDKKGQDLFIQGTKYLKSGNYEIADSLYTLSLCTYKNANIYYNRALARISMKDTIGFCDDLGIASSKYLDTNSEKLFNLICCKKVDTLYYDKKNNPSTKESYKYYEVIQDFKYENMRVGKFHEVGADNFIPYLDFGCNQDLLNIGGNSTDIIGIYKIIDSLKYYYFADKIPVLELENLKKYNNMKLQISNFFNMKYGELKKLNGIDQISIYFEIYLLNTGKISFVKYLGTFPEIIFFEKEKEFISDIEGYVKNYPELTPAKFLKKKVGFITVDSVVY